MRLDQLASLGLAWVVLAATPRPGTGVPGTITADALAAADVPALAGYRPEVVSANSDLVVSSPRWGPGIRVLEFEVTYLGTRRYVYCQYRVFSAAGAQLGSAGTFLLAASKTTTERLQVDPDVAFVELRLE